MKDAVGQAKPTGAPDTGEDFNGSRDLDHTNPTVQDNVKNYCKFLLDDLGYVGFRLDMAKGYGGQYTKIYNQYSKPKYCVGEYWDGNYDAVASWIEATGKESAAFDFPLKFCINEAFANKDYTKLVWKANGTTDQPAGLIHFGYQQYAVTFIDNHDTYREGAKFNGNVVAANAFILCSPGTPCVFWKHWSQHKAEIKKLIEIRNAVGLHNQSAVRVLRSSRDCYMAEVTGTKGKLVVKIGSAQVNPDGYSNSDIKASGTDYCVWSKTGGVNPDPIPDSDFTVYFDNSSSRWTTPYIYYWPDNSPTYPGVAMSKVEANVWKYTVPKGTTGILFNAGDGDATKTGDMTAISGHIYDKTGDKGVYGGTEPIPDTYPARMYLIGNLNGESWNTSTSLSAEGNNGVYTWTSVTVDPSVPGDKYGYFSYITTPGADWDAVNGGDRYGSATADEPITADVASNVLKYPANVSASSAPSWKATAGQYKFVLDLKNMKTTVSLISGVSEMTADEGDVRWFNLQGTEVKDPVSGVYIRVSNGIARKVLVSRN